MPNDMHPTEVTAPRLSVILHDVRSIYNVGSAFRTADAVGAGMVWLSGFTPGPDTHPERIAKTALGAQARVPWRRMRRAGDVLRRLRRAGAHIVALEVAPDADDYRAFRPTWPLAVLVGNEVEGVSAAMSHNVDAVVKIPMRGSKESLNVSVALGVALYEFTRRWK